MTTQPPDLPESSGRSDTMAPTSPPVDPGPGWGLMSERTDPDQRADYRGVAHIGHTAGSVWAPARTTSRSAERYPERTAAPR